MIPRIVNLELMMQRNVSCNCHLYSSFLTLLWHYNNINTWCRIIYLPCSMWWEGVHIDMNIFSLLFCTRVYSYSKHYISFDLFSQVYISRFLSSLLQSLYSDVKVSHICVPWFFNILLDNIFCEAWQSLQETLFDYLVMHEGTVIVLV